ncbi:hypothetical protein GCM10027321_07050 [Massilia terrae]|uniref:DUF4019 domain-containing protein n=1 Tax=Massilia terrae TaxID=1811224 RepID=A0ABT2CV25_9BURK|nr:DUF4019 domain-containing protein [Massilia terrae]MCS0656933.1 DUF4019 domain-containing protein [Massilia terrae]
MNHRIWLAALALAATFAHAQDNSAQEANVGPAAAAAERFLAAVDKGDVTGSYNEMAGASRLMVTLQQWDGAMKTVRAPLGRLESRRMVTAVPTRNLPGAPEGDYVVIQYNTRFSKLPDDQMAIETVTPMLDRDGNWHVSGYYVKQVPHRELKD